MISAGMKWWDAVLTLLQQVVLLFLFLFGIGIMPWKLNTDPSGFIFIWLITYSAFLGAVAGIIICDYYVINKKKLSLDDLLSIEGKYINL